MKYFLTLLLCLGFLMSSDMNAQEETKKVVVIKKVKDADGKTTTERKEASGAEADEMIKKMKEDGTLEGIDIDVEIEKAKKAKGDKKSIQKKIRIEKSIEESDEKKVYKIVTEEGGEKKVMKWTGDGEMPEEMKKHFKDEDVNVWVQKKSDEKENIEIIIEDDGEKKVMFWDGTGEMPAEMEKHIKHIDIKKSGDGEHMTITVETDDDGEHTEIHEMHEVEKIVRMKKASPNKVTLGVMIEDDSRGVVVSDIVEGSVAEKSGMKAGDTILKVDDTYVFNTDMLLKALSTFDKGDTAKITYLRDGKEKKVKAKF